MLYLDVSNEVKAKIPKKFFHDILDRFMKELKGVISKKLGKRHGQVDLVLVDDKAIKALNKEYRGKNKPTDVLSFAYLEITEFKKEKGDIIIGDIFISADIAAKQAKKAKHSLKKEMEVLFVHGMLHLLGLDHKTDKQEREMEKWAGKVVG